MNPKIEPIFNPYENIGPYRISHRVSSSPYEEGKYAPHLHIRAYHENVRKVRVSPYSNETIELSVPKKFILSDTKRFVADNEMALFAKLKEVLDNQFDVSPEPLTYDSKVPFLGKELPIRSIPENSDDTGYIEDGAAYLKQGLSSVEIHEVWLTLLGEVAYGLLKPKLDRYAKAMRLRYNRLEIDDGRRTFGSFNDETKVIFLSRRLLIMSEPVVDFLIVHELAHAVSLSHGEEHDAVIGKVLPNYDEIDSKFNDYCSRLIEQGWI